jgi:hypothetical protein
LILERQRVCSTRAVGRAVGIKKVETGKEGSLGGVVGGAVDKVYYHPVKLCLDAHMINVIAGFSENLGVAAILGRSGLFDHYTISFDPCNNPPGLELERFYRT